MTEVLAPAGNLASAYAAFKGGADAIYIGGKSFSARAGAANFSNDEIREIVFFAHSIRRKVYVTLNTLLFQDEFMEAVEFAGFLYSINIDGVIIQDLGLAHYLHKTLPDLPLNASTQLSCHNLKQAKALIKVGFKRIVLARETTLDFAKQVKALGVEVEIFAHGALCVSYSGNCLMSSFIGDRSGNRGRCAQPCRMNYEIIENGKSISNPSFAISTKDLMTLDYIKEIRKAKIDSIKIEGRLKSEEYIYLVSRAYKHALRNEEEYLSNDKEDLIKIFNRKFTKGYLFDESPFKLLNTETSSHQGEVIGMVVDAYKNRVAIKLSKDVSRLDGIRFNSKEQFGLSIEKMFLNRNPVEEAKKGQTIELSGINNAERLKGLEVIRTKDVKLVNGIQDELKEPLKSIVNIKFKAHKDEPIKLTIIYGDIEVEAYGPVPFEKTSSNYLVDKFESQLCKTGNYPFEVFRRSMDVGDVFIQISELNKIRNEAFDKLLNVLRTTKECNPILYENKDYKLTNNLGYKAIVETQEQENAINQFGVLSYAYFDNEFKNELRISNENDFKHTNELMHFIIEKENEGDLIASPYCNITNSYALDCFYEFGFTECVLSLELDDKSIQSMISDFEKRHQYKPSVGIVTYGKVDTMIMKSCPVGTLYNNKGTHCNRCHKNKYELEDRIGARYRLIGDPNCNTRVLLDKPICLFNKLDEIENNNIVPYILFTDENESKVNDVMNSYFDRKNMQNTTKGHYLRRPQ